MRPCKRWLVSVICVFSVQPVVGVAEPTGPLCPDRVSVVEGSDLTASVLARIESIYRQLGCDTRFVSIPGQRSIVDFNHSEVGGELMRIAGVESKYQRPFVRSEVPVAEVHSALWMHPENRQVGGLVGYQLGVVWQKRYASQLDNSLQMYSSSELYAAYNRGDLHGFLSSYSTEERFVSRQRLVPRPVIEKNLPDRHFYHYLGQEYAPLMQQISQRLMGLSNLER